MEIKMFDKCENFKQFKDKYIDKETGWDSEDIYTIEYNNIIDLPMTPEIEKHLRQIVREEIARLFSINEDFLNFNRFIKASPSICKNKDSLDKLFTMRKKGFKNFTTKEEFNKWMEEE